MGNTNSVTDVNKYQDRVHSLLQFTFGLINLFYKVVNEHAKNPDNVRFTLCEWQHPSWPFGGIHSNRHLGAIPENAGTYCVLCVCG